MLKIGVLATQNLKKELIAVLNKVDHIQLAGVYHPEGRPLSTDHSENTKLPVFNSFDSFCENVDAIYISEPKTEQFDLLIQLLKKSKHLFFERAITFSSQQSSMLLETASEAGVKIQIGHLKQFNPAFVAIKSLLNQPELIIAQSLTAATDKNREEVIDLLIDDIVIALLTVDAEVKRVHATGVSVISHTPDVIQAKIEFINGTVVNLTGSRVSTNKSHQTEFYGKNSYLKVDFIQKLATRLIPNTKSSNFTYQLEEISTKPTNALGQELNNFYNSIVHNSEPEVSVYTSFKAIQIARQILDKTVNSSNFGG